MLEEASDGLTAQEIAQQLGVSTRTAQRDLKALRASGYPLSSAGARWRFVDGQALPTTLAADGAGEAPERDRVLILDRAIRARRPARLDHHPLGPGAPARLRLAPLSLRYLDGSLFLIAREHPRGRLQVLAVERLSNIELLPGRASPDAREGLESFVTHHLRSQAASELVRVTIELDPAAAWRVTERTWHPSQRVSAGAEGATEVTFRVPGLAWVQAWLLGLGAAAVAIEPPELVRALCGELERARERYDQRCHRLTAQLDLFEHRK